MKKRLIISGLVLLQIAGGCDKYLGQYPHNAVPDDHITVEHAGLLENGIYNIAQYKPTFNGWALFDIIGGDLIRPGASGVNTPKLLVEMGIAPNQSIVTSPWNGFYAGMYQINVYINTVEGMKPSQEKNEFLGVGHFFRGLYYYNIVARWRNVPIVTGNETEEVGQTPEAQAWEFVVSELRKAVEYSADFTHRNIVSRQAAKALLARTYLAMGKKSEAAELAEEVIADPMFALSDFQTIFRGGENREEIFTFANLQHEGRVNMSSYYYTKESPVGGSYNFCPTQEVMEMYSEQDNRKEISVDVQSNNNVVNKYCSGDAGQDPLYMIRLAEMYLISAEGQGLAGGLARLNELRVFRGLPAVNPATEEEFLDAVLEERRLELFGEGFRWFDLVRTGKYEEKTGLDSKYTVLPIPARELTLNKKLRQHPLWDAALHKE